MASAVDDTEVPHSSNSEENGVLSNVSILKAPEVHPALESSEVIQALFKFLDFRKILTSRLISKLWNDEACLVLKETSFAHLCGKSEESVEEINDLIDDAIKSGRSHPFRNFFVYVKDVASEGLQRILDRPNIVIHGLNYHTEGASTGNVMEKREYLRQFLARFGISINHIIYVFDSEVELDDIETDMEALQTPTDFQLPILKSFEYWERDVVTAAESVDFLVEILSRCPKFVKFASNTHYSSIYDGLVRRRLFQNLEDLHVIDCRLRNLNNIFGVTMPNLRALAVQIWQNTSSRMTSTSFLGIIRKICGTIEQLSVSFIDFTLIGIQLIPTCPALKDFLLHDWRGSFSIFSQDKFPNLSRVFISDYAMDMLNHLHFVNDPHPGVAHLGCRGSGLERVRQGEYLASLLDCIPVKFPNLNSLSLVVDEFPTKVLNSVLKNLSHLECLEIQKFSSSSDSISVESMEDFFTGINKYTLERLTRSNEADISIFPRSTCLLDMSRLKNLTVLQNGQGIILTNNAIQYGIARLPNLKTFTFDMNPMLSLDIVRDHLRHLDGVTVKMDVKSMEEAFDEDTVGDFEDMLASLTASMRQAVVDHSALNPIDKFDFRNY